MKDLIIKDPSKSVVRLIEEFKEYWGTGYRGKKILELKRELGYDGWGRPLSMTRESPKTAAIRTALVSAARAEGKKIDARYPIVVQTSPSDTPISFAKRLLDTLREKGLTNLTVSASEHTWVAIEPAP